MKVITLSRSKTIKKWFKEQPKSFRIESVIHDGEFYTIEKWAKVAQVLEGDILQYIYDNQEILIKCQDSYRVNTEEVFSWYKKNNLNINKPIIPNNFIPKIFDNKTEIENFTDKRNISSLTVECDDFDLLEKIKSICYEYGKVDIVEQNRIVIYTLDCFFIKERIEKILSDKELKEINMRTRQSFKRRELSTFSTQFMIDALPFYVNYGMGVVKGHKKTMDIFIPNHDDQYAKIYEWILKALAKYDNNTGVPFLAYLTRVLMSWPYDLPENELGKKLALFQRRKAKAEQLLIHDKKTENISQEELYNIMKDDYTKEEFNDLFREHLRWLELKNSSSFNYNTIPKSKIDKIKLIKYEKDNKLSSQLSYSLLKTALETKDMVSFYNVIGKMSDFQFGDEISINDNFKKSLYDNLQTTLKKEDYKIEENI